MDGASGDDWIAVRTIHARLSAIFADGRCAGQANPQPWLQRARRIRCWMARCCSRRFLLLSGLGEVSRIGEVILNPFLGPRLKSGVVTTDMPMAHDKPIDFGLQTFCEAATNAPASARRARSRPGQS